MPIAPPPVIVPDKCIFYLAGTKERTGKWRKSTFDPNNVEIIDNKYTSKNSTGKVTFAARIPIKSNTKAFTISCFVKRTAISGSWQEIGFCLNNSVSYDCGFCDADKVYLDDSTSGASFVPSAASVINGNYTDTFFFAFSREEDGSTNHLFLNGKLIATDNRYSAYPDIFNKITLFDADTGGAMIGWIDKVVIHKDICLYKEDFTVLPMDQYPEYKYTEDDNSLKLY